MKTYIPKKHYTSFWKMRLFGAAYGKNDSLVNQAFNLMGGKLEIEGLKYPLYDPKTTSSLRFVIRSLKTL